MYALTIEISVWVKLGKKYIYLLLSMARSKSISTQSSSVKEFLETASKIPVPVDDSTMGKLIFAMDATASREPCWDMACQLQSEMFTETAAIGKLLIQLCYFQGFGEFKFSNWTQNAVQLQEQMSSVRCKAGQTQIGRVLDHALEQSKSQKLNAVVYVGDSMEELAETLYKKAGQLALRSIPIFIFHEGIDPMAQRTFQKIARITNGAYCPFDQSSAEQLRALLNAVAIFAVGGLDALKAHSKKHANLNIEIIRQLTDQSS